MRTQNSRPPAAWTRNPAVSCAGRSLLVSILVLALLVGCANTAKTGNVSWRYSPATGKYVRTHRRGAYERATDLDHEVRMERRSRQRSETAEVIGKTALVTAGSACLVVVGSAYMAGMLIGSMNR